MTEASRLDRLIFYLLPTAGARRIAARRAVAELSYEGARRGRREENWVTGGTSANAEIAIDRLTLRQRVRSLLRDNPYAVKGAATLVSNRIGTGILASADSKNKRDNARVDARWERWIDRCDLSGRSDYYGLLALAERSRVESGEALVRFVMLPQPVDDDDVPLRLQVLESDFIDTTKNEHLSASREIREGIEYDGIVPVAYWLFKSHPGENSPLLPFSLESERIPATQILHYYRPLRPGQLTGVSEFSPVIRRLWDIDGYADAELLRKKIAACSVGFVTSPAPLPGSSVGPTKIGVDGRRTETFAPGMYHYGRAGENIEFFDPKPSEGYREFFGVELHAIAAGLGIPYELLTGDLSEVTYTSHRGGLVQFRAMIEADQWQLVIPQLCRPIWNRFVRESEMVPKFRMPVKFTPPRFGLLDPAKEIPAMVQAIQAGLRSHPDTLRREGDEPMKVLEEIEAWKKELDRRGLTLTSDGRNAVKSEAPKPEKDPEATPDPENPEDAKKAA